MKIEKKRIVVTGASGFVGSLLVPRLLAADCHLLLVGRSPHDLAQKYPETSVCTYEELAEKGQGFDMLVHLAGLHAGKALDEESTQHANIDLPVSVAHTVVAAGIRVMLYRCSTHALDFENNNLYTRSKREAIARLKVIDGLELRIAYMPLVYGDHWQGRFSVLNLLPNHIARAVFLVIAAFKPTCHIDHLTSHILDGALPASTLLSDRQMNNPVYSAVMRLIDLAFAVAVLVLLGWLLVLIWTVIRVGSPGPGIFSQPRVGRGGEEFTCHKFRTMKQGTPQVGTHELTVSSVTKIGKFLRKSKIDELPQVINIFRNEISLIGPRPCLPVQDELIEERHSRGVLDIKPGISGLAQINDIDMSDPVRLAEWDAKYLGLRSILLDLKIALATVRGRGQGDKTVTNATQQKSPQGAAFDPSRDANTDLLSNSRTD